MPPSKLSTLVRPRKRSRLVIYIFPGLGKPIGDTSYKTVRNTIHSGHNNKRAYNVIYATRQGTLETIPVNRVIDTSLMSYPLRTDL